MSKKDKTIELNAQVKYWQVKQNHSIKDLSIMLGICPASLYNKLKDYEKFTVREMKKLMQILKLPDEKIVMFII